MLRHSKAPQVRIENLVVQYQSIWLFINDRHEILPIIDLDDLEWFHVKVI